MPSIKERYEAALKDLENAETQDQVDGIKSTLATLQDAMNAAKEGHQVLEGLAPKKEVVVKEKTMKTTPNSLGAAAAAHVKERGIVRDEKFAFSAGIKTAAPMGLITGQFDTAPKPFDR